MLVEPQANNNSAFFPMEPSAIPLPQALAAFDAEFAEYDEGSNFSEATEASEASEDTDANADADAETDAQATKPETPSEPQAHEPEPQIQPKAQPDEATEATEATEASPACQAACCITNTTYLGIAMALLAVAAECAWHAALLLMNAVFCAGAAMSVVGSTAVCCFGGVVCYCCGASLPQSATYTDFKVDKSSRDPTLAAKDFVLRTVTKVRQYVVSFSSVSECIAQRLIQQSIPLKATAATKAKECVEQVRNHFHQYFDKHS